MNKSPLRPAGLLLAGLGFGGLLACEPLVDVKLKLVEPCDQREQALNGVETFELSHDGPGENNTTVFTRGGSSRPLVMRELAEEVVVTVRGFEGDIDADGAGVVNGTPKSIGRSLPLEIGGNSPDMDLVVLMGMRDSFGQVTDEEGACQALDNGHDSVRGRHGHTATFIEGANKVLIAGGAVWAEENGQKGESFLRTAELFDPATGTFKELPEMTNARGYHTATALGDGRVLIVGGFGVIGGQIQALTNGLLYDPAAPIDSPWEVVTFQQQRALHTATLLEDQQLVVIVGGCSGQGCRPDGVTDPGDGDPTAAPKMRNTVEVFDIVTGTTKIATDVAQTPRALHAASALEGGRVLVSGGVNANGLACDMELFQSTQGSLERLDLESTETTFSSCPVGHAQVTLSRDRVMFLGGQTNAPGGTPQGAGSDAVQFWNSLVGIETLRSTMLSGRYGHSALMLDDGSVLVVGGSIAAGSATAERVIADGNAQNPTFTGEALDGPTPRVSRHRAAVATLPNNQALLSGGYVVDGQTTTDSVELYFGD